MTVLSEKHEVHIGTSFKFFCLSATLFWNLKIMYACLVKFLWNMLLFLELLHALYVMGKFGLIWLSLEPQ